MESTICPSTPCSVDEDSFAVTTSELPSTKIFALPQETRREIMKYMPLIEVRNIYEAEGMSASHPKGEPSYEDLCFLANQHQLPYATNLNTLLSFMNEMNEEERLQYCIKYHDDESFARLYASYKGKLDVEILMDDGLGNGVYRPYISHLILLRMVKEGKTDYDCCWIATYQKDYEIMAILFTQGIDLYAEMFDRYTEDELIKVINLILQHDIYKVEKYREFWEMLFAETAYKNFLSVLDVILSLDIHVTGKNIYDHTLSHKASYPTLLFLAQKVENVQPILRLALNEGHEDIIEIIEERYPGSVNTIETDIW